MLSKRIIACLDINNGRTVKGVQFKDLIDAGDPVELALAYSQQGIDELVFLDITASTEKRALLYDLVKKIAKRIHIPFTVGGGISDISDVQNLLNAGADKITINSAAINQPNLINQLSERFGSQCIVVAIDAKLVNGTWQVYKYGGKENCGISLFEWAIEVQERGAGEILFTSMNADGEKKGFEIAALSKLKDILSIPLIASGGAGSIQHFEDVFLKSKVDAALAASIFHFKEVELVSLKKQLSEKAIPIRI